MKLRAGCGRKTKVVALVALVALVVTMVAAEFFARQKVYQQIFSALVYGDGYTVHDPKIEVDGPLILVDLVRAELGEVTVVSPSVDLVDGLGRALRVDEFHAQARGVGIAFPHRIRNVTASGALSFEQLKRMLPDSAELELVGEDGLVVVSRQEGFLRLEAHLSVTPADCGRALKLAAQSVTVNRMKLTDLGQLSKFEYLIELDQVPEGISVDAVTVGSEAVTFHASGTDVNLAQATTRR